MKQVLHVGCGPTIIPDYFAAPEWREVRYDIDPSCNPHIVGSLDDMSVFEDGAFDALYSAHNIEHLYVKDAYRALKEFYRVLKPRGVCYILTPDIQALGEVISTGQLEKILFQSQAGPITAADLLWGWKNIVSHEFSFMAHKYCFTASTLTYYLNRVGFKSILTQRRPHSYELAVIATPESF